LFTIKFNFVYGQKDGLMGDPLSVQSTHEEDAEKYPVRVICIGIKLPEPK